MLNILQEEFTIENNPTAIETARVLQNTKYKGYLIYFVAFAGDTAYGYKLDAFEESAKARLGN